MNKTYIYILLSLILIGCKDDAELNTIKTFHFSPINVQINPQSATLNVELQTNKPIEEKGFYIVRTYQTNPHEGLYSQNSTEIITLSPEASFEHTITSDMEKDQTCTIFAFFKQDNHYYRSAEYSFQPIGCTPPHIISAKASYDANNNKILTIKGENFSTLKERNKIQWYVNDHKYSIGIYDNDKIIKSTPNELIIPHPFSDARDMYSLNITVSGNQSNDAYFQIEGTIITSWEPQHPRYGENITLSLQGFKKGMGLNYITSTGNGTTHFNHTHEFEDNQITIQNRMNHKFVVYGETTSPNLYFDCSITPSVPWKEKTNKQVRFDSHGIIDDNLYLTDNAVYAYGRLLCYNFKTSEWSEYPYEKLDGNPNCTLWNHEKYIYLLQTLESEQNTIKAFSRFNTLTCKWEKLADSPTALPPTGTICLENDIYVFYEHKYFHYIPQNDTWQVSEQNITPAIKHIAGSYQDYIYYLAQSGNIYKIKKGNTGEAELVLEIPTDCISISLSNSNLYYLSQESGIVKYNLAEQKKHLLGLPSFHNNHTYNSYHFMEYNHIPYTIITQDVYNYSYFYQFVEDRK